MSIRDDLRQRVDAIFEARKIPAMQPSKGESCMMQTLGDATCNFSEIRATESATRAQQVPAKPRGIRTFSATGYATATQQLSCTGPENKTIDATQESELQWREFEALLAIVGPAYRTPADEYPAIRKAAQKDLANALIAFRNMARQCSHPS